MPQATAPTIMGRIKRDIEIDGRQCWTLFDSGARNSYIARRAVGNLNNSSLKNPAPPIRLGGGQHTIREICDVEALIDGHPCFFQACVLDEIGHDEDGREIDLLFGALAMQKWSIRLDLKNERLDLSHFTTEFLEF
jgi:hypothetical protein